MTEMQLPLATPRTMRRRRQAMHVDDLGRALDRVRILLGSSIEELDVIADIVPETGEIADQLDRIKEQIVDLWDGLPEPELPLA